MNQILAVFAHPDDETFICGGTLAKAARHGWDVVLLCATRGEMGRRIGIPPMACRETIGAVREAKLRAACAALGVSAVHFLGCRDKALEIQPPADLRRTVLRHMKRLCPDVVITFHGRWGGHPDHCAIGEAATAAFLDYRRRRPGKLFFVCKGDMIRRPEAYGLSERMFTVVDVSDCLLEKERARRAHQTQSQTDGESEPGHRRGMAALWLEEYFIDADAISGTPEIP